MKNIYGNNITVTLFGESHGAAIGAVIDGIAPGIEVDYDLIEKSLLQRQGDADISTPRREGDKVEFLSGIKNGVTEGTPIALIIKNENKNSNAYSPYENTPRPSHADYAAEEKYHGFQDKSGGGHFSGRITAPLVATGAIIRSALEKKGILIGTHIKSLHGIADRGFFDYSKDIAILAEKSFPALSREAETLMKNEILSAKSNSDSVGGELETVIFGVPAGVGEPWFDTVEGVLAHACLSIPGVKGIEFGEGFDLCGMLGSEANDPLRIKDGKVTLEKNSNGGINGGITNGMPILFTLAVKPTPSIAKAQRTVDLRTMENCEIEIKGRHDPAIIHRARAVVDAVSAIAIADLLVTRFGTDWLRS